MRFDRLFFLFTFFSVILFTDPAFSATYTYDNANRLTTIDHGDGTVINYTYDAKGNLTSTNVFVDIAAPTGSIVINNGASSTTSQTVTLSLPATDDSGTVSQMRFSNDNATWAAWETYYASGTYLLPIGDGNKTIYVQFKDGAGKVSSTYSASIILDTGHPVLTITPAGGFYTSVQNVTISSNEQATIYYTTDGSTPGPGSPVYSAPITLNSPTTLTYVGIDNAGNSSPIQSQTYAIDLVPPTGTISINGGAAGTNVSSVTLTLSASDDSGTVSQMRFSNDNVTWTEWEPYAVTKGWVLSSGEGQKTIYVQFNDAAGRISNAYADSILFDTVAPIVSASPAGGLYNAMLSVSLASNKTGTTIYYTVNPAMGYYVYAGPIWFRCCINTLSFYGVDSAGNVGQTQTLIYKIDASAPFAGSILINGGAASANSASVTLNLSAQDWNENSQLVTPTHMRFSNDNVTWSEWETYAPTKAWTLSGSEGTQTVYAQFKDNAGNISGTYSDSILMDTPPVITATPVGGIYTTAQTVALTSNEIATIYYTIDGSVPTTASLVYSSPLLISATTTLKYIGVDGTGSTSAVESQTYTIDSVAPTGSILINGGAANTTSTAVTLTLSATDNSGTVSQMRFSNDNITWSAWENYSVSKAWTLTDGNGSKTVYVEFKDLAGNISQPVSATITFGIQGIDLVIDSLTAPSTAPSGGNITINYTVTNQGMSNSGAYYIDFYLTTDPINGTPSDLFLTQASKGVLAGSSSEPGSLTVQIPLSIPAGTYYVRAIADSLEWNTETNETNNARASATTTTVTKEIDLVIDSLTAPSTAPSGSNITVNYTVRNQGTASSGAYYVDFYLTTDPVNGTPSDLFLTQASKGILAGGSSDPGSLTVQIPLSIAAGTYYVRAVADSLEWNTETNETNNARASATTTTVTKEIDLVIDSLTAPSTAAPGSNITINYTVRNQGTASSGAYYVDFYLTTDPVNGTPSDLFLTQASRGVLAGSSSDTGSLTVQIPTSAAAGTYYIRSLADSLEWNTETNETNNTRASAALTVSN